MSSETQFQGWLGKDKDAVNGKMEWGQFEPKKWTEDDVDIEISHCGICGSDLHTLKSGWGETPYRAFPFGPIAPAATLLSSTVCQKAPANSSLKPVSSATKSSAKP